MSEETHIVSFPFRLSYYESVSELPESEQLALYRAIFAYAFYGEKIPLTGISNALMIALKPNIACSKKAVVDGSKGGRPRHEKGGYSSEERGVIETEKGGFAKPKSDVDVDIEKDIDIDTDVDVTTAHVERPASSDIASRQRRDESSSFSTTSEIADYPDIWDLNNDPVKMASSLCRENDARSRGGFGNQMKRVGDQAFRIALAAFFGEIRAGEEPRRRGSALMARLKALPSESESIEAREVISKIGG